MKRATLHVIVHSICCAKIKGVDGEKAIPLSIESMDEPVRSSNGEPSTECDSGSD